jgi:ACS family hexuronate transporter-like MFS transporter
MESASMDLSAADDRSRLKWFVCGMLLLALVLNYMDRQTLSLTITAIERQIQLNNAQYGRLEKGFGYAFAIGGLVFGLLADKLSIRWLYPAVLLGWSGAGLATGFADRIGQTITPLLRGLIDVDQLAMTKLSTTLTDPETTTNSYIGFLICRVILGFFEAGQWPCALVTTQRLLAAADRPFGNSILQSGASIGAILTPLVIGLFDPLGGKPLAENVVLAPEQLGWWRAPYVVIGCLGVLWVFPWLDLVRRIDLSIREPAKNSTQTDKSSSSSYGATIVRRLLALVVVVIAINMTWQFFRVWLPKMLEQEHGYTPQQVRWIILAYYIATDLGCIAAGATVKWLAARNWNVHHARVLTFGFCASLTALSTLAAGLPRGPLLIAVFLVIGFGALGLFPNYYSFTQEISARHQGRVSGALGFITWVVSSEMQEIVGKTVDKEQSYATGIFWIGLAPLAGCVALLLLWGKTETSGTERVASQTST